MLVGGYVGATNVALVDLAVANESRCSALVALERHAHEQTHAHYMNDNLDAMCRFLSAGPGMDGGGQMRASPEQPSKDEHLLLLTDKCVVGRGGTAATPAPPTLRHYELQRSLNAQKFE